ncbi:MAG: HAMP domain-containing histidine kinase [Lachnospiraceae bacterium]|nr:HAMP domain-containing histidine kinase [Lachnospiraceae bacterium]
MSEKKSDRRFLYSNVGKFIRRILCMATFVLFLFCLGVCVCVFKVYGGDVVYKDYSLYDSMGFRNRIASEANMLLESLIDVENNQDMRYMKIIDVENNVINTYDNEKIAEDQIDYVEDIDQLEPYIKSGERLRYDVYNYTEALKLISSSKDETYIHFSPEAFEKIFKDNGVQNIGYCLSNRFSSSAYIIYADSAVMKNLHDIIGSEEATEYTLNISPETEGNDYITIGKQNIIDMTGYDTENMECAVFDPESDLFYSSWDDFFTPFSGYTYKISDLKATLSQNKQDIGSIIFLLLWSENYDNYGDYYSAIVEDYQWLKYSEDIVGAFEKSAYKYCVKGAGKKVVQYGNVDDEDDMTGNAVTYFAKTGYVDGSTVKLKDITKSLSAGNNIVKKLDSQYGIGTMYFGIDESKVSFNDESTTVAYVWGYNTFGKYIIAYIAGAIIGLILLVIQAVSLIKTAGRKRADDEEVRLLPYDKIPTEVWVLISISLIAASVVFVVFDIQKTLNHYLYSKNYVVLLNAVDKFKLMMVATVAALPFGVFFMELTLSFVRRIKAHNLKSKSIIKYLITRWERSEKSVEKLKALTRVYIGLEVFWCVLLAVLWRTKVIKSLNILFIMFIVFMLLMWFVTSFISHRLIEDITKLKEGVARITGGDLDSKVVIDNKCTVFRELETGINNISDGLKNAVEKSLKDERMKTELITNVSHDLKTPLTSIINYINLLKSEKMPTPEAEHYIEVLDQKANRLKQLTEDLVEAAKATSGNLELSMMPLSFDELMRQALGECEEKLAEKQLTIVTSLNGKAAAGPSMVMVDGRRLFRVLDNILQNAYKYAMEGTRIYVDLSNEDGVVHFSMKNISKAQLNISADELMERFTRGDSSRTTEGSGLGLSIAKDLTKLMGGTFNIELDGDLFKVVITFPEYIKPASTPSQQDA